ncbi:MAG: hypothetical protein Q8M29_09365 [Bacteroidota bacterium]|nr:hypothetical protein [Bacteroidota bacterium]
MENVNKNIELLNVKLFELVGTYNKLKKAIDKNEKEDLKELYLLRAGKNLEALVNYIVRKEKIIVTCRPQNGKINPDNQPTLDDCIFHLKKNKIITQVISDDFYNIKNWRNKNSHHQESDNNAQVNLIRDSTIESVYDSFKDVISWFFEIYLKGDYADFSKNIYASQEKIKEPSKEELDEIKKNFEKNPFNIPDLSILKQSKQYKNAIRRKKQRASFLLLLIGTGLAYLVYHFYFENSNKKAKHTVAAKTHMNKDQVYDFLIRYFNSSNDLNSDAHEYFASNVDTFYFRYNVNPTEIDIIRQQNTEYIDNKNSIDKESLYPSSKADSITRWRFWTEYTCYRPKLKKFQNSKVQLEFGINTENKITCIKQVKKTKEKYTKEKPY